MDQLWDDIVETAETRLTQPHVTHFIGSLVRLFRIQGCSYICQAACW
ncbi:hypothetical protein [Acidipropionibacterium jensenii]